MMLLNLNEKVTQETLKMCLSLHKYSWRLHSCYNQTVVVVFSSLEQLPGKQPLLRGWSPPVQRPAAFSQPEVSGIVGWVLSCCVVFFCCKLHLACLVHEWGSLEGDDVRRTQLIKHNRDSSSKQAICSWICHIFSGHTARSGCPINEFLILHQGWVAWRFIA